MANKRVVKFALVGVGLTLINFGIYTFLARVIFKNNDLLWVATIISTTISTIVAYFLHAKITWKEKHPTKIGMMNFFIWNITVAVAINPFLTWVFGSFKGIYEIIFKISSALSLPFDYAFVESTSIFVLVAIITMILNYLFYDKLVFGEKK